MLNGVGMKRARSRASGAGGRGCASEHAEAVALVRACVLAEARHPELGLLFAVPNGGHRNPVVAARMKAEGVKRGVPDYMLPVPRGPWHGLFVELKRERGGRVSEDQRRMIRLLEEQGYRVVVARGWVEAYEAIMEYLGVA